MSRAHDKHDSTSIGSTRQIKKIYSICKWVEPKSNMIREGLTRLITNPNLYLYLFCEGKKKDYRPWQSLHSFTNSPFPPHSPPYNTNCLSSIPVKNHDHAHNFVTWNKPLIELEMET